MTIAGVPFYLHPGFVIFAVCMTTIAISEIRTARRKRRRD